MEFTMPDSTKVPDTGKFMDIRRRQADGRWLFTHDIFNSDIPLPTEPAPTP
jgi:ketosteroid isomerase-like protein